MNLKKILALVLVFAMCLSMVPTYAFAEDEGIELVEEEPEAIVEVVDEPEEEPSTEPEEEETPQEPVEEEVPEEPAPTEEEPEEEPEEEEEEELVLTSEGVKDDESFEKGFILRAFVHHKNGGEDSQFQSLYEAVKDETTLPGDTIYLTTDSNVADYEGLDPYPGYVPVDKAVTIDGQDHKINNQVQVTAAATFQNVTFAYDETVTGGNAVVFPVSQDDFGAEPAVFQNVTFGVKSNMRFFTLAKAKLINVTMNSTLQNITGYDAAGGDAHSILEIESGTFKGKVAGGAGAISGGTFVDVEKRLLAFGYVTDDYNGTYVDEPNCTGEVYKDTAVYQAGIFNKAQGYYNYYDTDSALQRSFGEEVADPENDAANRIVRFIVTPTSINYKMPTYTNVGGERVSGVIYVVADAFTKDMEILSAEEDVGYHVGQTPVEHTPFAKFYTWQYRAKIVDKGYMSLHAAYADYQDGQIIDLLAPLASPSDLDNDLGPNAVVLGIGKSVKIRTNNNAITINSTDPADDNIKTNNSAYFVTEVPDAADPTVTVYKSEIAKYTVTHKVNGTDVISKCSTFENALAVATDTDIIEAVPDVSGTAVVNAVTIDKAVTLENITFEAPITIASPTNAGFADYGVTLTGDIRMSGEASFIIDNGAMLRVGGSFSTSSIQNPGGTLIANGIENFATIENGGNLWVNANVTLNNLTDSAIVAGEKASISLANGRFAATMAEGSTAPVFKGGFYVIGNDRDTTRAIVEVSGAYGFENAKVLKNDGSHEVIIRATEAGLFSSDLVVLEGGLFQANANPNGVGFAGSDFFVAIDSALERTSPNAVVPNKKGLVAYVTENGFNPYDRTYATVLAFDVYYPAFATAAVTATYTNTTQAADQKTVYITAAPEKNDFLQFTDINQMLRVEVKGNFTVTYTNLAEAYYDDNVDMYYVVVNGEPTRELSQARAQVIVVDTETNTAVKGYGSLIDAAQPDNYDPKTQHLFVRADQQPASPEDEGKIKLTKDFADLYIVRESASIVVAEKLVTVDAPNHVKWTHENTSDHAHFVDKLVNITWDAGENGYWFRNSVPEEEGGKLVHKKYATGTTLEPVADDAVVANPNYFVEPGSSDPVLAFIGWTDNTETGEIIDFGKYKLPEDSNVVTFTALYGDAVVTLQDKGGYVYAFSTIEQAYLFMDENEALKADLVSTSPTVHKDVELCVDADVFRSVPNSNPNPWDIPYKPISVINDGHVITTTMTHVNMPVEEATPTDIFGMWTVTCSNLPNNEQVYKFDYLYDAVVVDELWTYTKKTDGSWSKPSYGEPTYNFYATVTLAVENGFTEKPKEAGNKMTQDVKTVLTAPYIAAADQYTLTDAVLLGEKELAVCSYEPGTNPIKAGEGSSYTYKVEKYKGQETAYGYVNIDVYWLPTVTVTFIATTTALATPSQIIEKLEPVESSVSIASPSSLPEIEGHTFQYFCTDTNAPETSKVVFVDGQYTVYAEKVEGKTTDTNLTIYAYYTPDEYTVTLEYFDEATQKASSTNISGIYGTPVTIDAATATNLMTGSGRVFDFWSLATGTEVEEVTPDEFLKENKTYYAIAQPQITFMVSINGTATETNKHVIDAGKRGEKIATQTVLNIKSDLFKVKFDGKLREFDYWSLTPGGAPVATDSILPVPNVDTTYYAVAKPWDTVNFVLYVDGKVTATSTTIEGNRGAAINPETVRATITDLFAGTGREFDFWATPTDASVDVGTPTNIGPDTYYAVAKPRITITLQAVVDKNLASSTTLVENRDVEKDVSDDFKKSEKALFTDGRVFDYWATGTDVSNLTKVSTPADLKFEENMTYYAVAKPKITVTLSSWIDGKPASSTSLTKNRDEIASPTEVKEFFENAQTTLFKGTERKFYYWATPTDVDAKYATPTTLTFDKDQTYYAIPAPVYTLTLKYGENIQEIVGDAGSRVEEAKVASATNALFKGTGDEFATWTDVLGTPTSLPKTFTADLTFVAVAQPKVEVTFDAGSGVFKDPVTGKNTNTSTTEANKNYPVDAKYQELWDTNKPSRAHYKFNGWLDKGNNLVLATQTIVTPTTLTASWSGEEVRITFYDSYSRESILSDPQYYGDDLKKPTVEQVKATVGSRPGYTFFSDDLWEEELVSPIAGNKTYNLKWYQVLSSVPCIVAEPDKQTQVYEFKDDDAAAVGRTLSKPPALNNVKQGGKIANWLINGDPERYFEFDKDLVPEDLEFFLATFTDAPVPTPTDLFTVTWATDNGAKILEIDEDVLYGSKPDFNGVVPTMTNTADEFYYFDGWTIFGDTSGKVYTEDELPAVTEDFEFHAYFKAVPHKESGLRSLSLGDSIAIKWRLNPDSIDSHADMSLYRAVYKFTNGEDEETTGEITGDDLLVARPIAYCAAKEMTLPVTVTLFYDGVEIAEFEYTVRDYCLDGLKSKTLDAKWKNLFAATLDYGAGAQTFKNFKTNDLANAGVTYTYAKEELKDVTATVTKSTGVTFNLITEAETLMQIKFATGGKDISDFTFKVGTKDVTDTVKVENNKFVVNIGGIPARQLDQSVTVTMTPKADGEILRFLGSPVGYMKTAFVNGKAPLPAFMEAMYNYHFYAKAAQG